jgi:hypothetical protein
LQHQAAELGRDKDTMESLRRCALTRTSRRKDELLRFILAPDGTIVPVLKGLPIGWTASSPTRRSVLSP